jgi:hypothetical protein
LKRGLSGIRAWSLIHNEKKQLFSLRKLPCNREVRGHYTCKEMPVNRALDKKRMIGKWRAAEEE